MPEFVPLVQVHRGGPRESVHVGAYVLRRGSQVVRVGGDPQGLTYYRSASKPLQALVAVTSGAAEAFGWGPRELAIASGSHSGTPTHVEVVRGMLASAGLESGPLQCGAHWPFDADARRQARAAMDTPDVLFSNCSGKHAAMLAAAKSMGAPLETHLDPTHPVQVEIRAHIAACADLPVDAVQVSIDGCGAPTFALPLDAAARSMQQVGRPDPGPLAEALAATRDAMLAHPDLVGGPGRFDTVLMASSARPLLAKAGAEGIHATVIPDDDAVLFVKCADGQDRGYRRFVVGLLAQEGYLTGAEAAEIEAAVCPRELRNHAGAVVGTVDAVLPA